MRLPILVLALALLSGAPAFAADQTLQMDGLQVTVWSQQPPPPGKQPVLIFSHGLYGCDVQTRFLMEAFAANGYLVFAPNHRDAGCHGGKSGIFSGTESNFSHPESWNENSYRDRAQDIRRLIAAIHTDPRFSSRADWSRFGLVGHSLGGYTVLGLAGAWPGWKLDGVKAVLALSPYCQPFEVQHTLSQLRVPVMYQGGTWDFGITPELNRAGGCYDQTPAPKYYEDFSGAGHFAWTNLGWTARKQIVDYSLAFLNHYVKGEPADPLLERSLDGVSRLRYDSGRPGAAAAPPQPGQGAQ